MLLMLLLADFSCVRLSCLFLVLDLQTCFRFEAESFLAIKESNRDNGLCFIINNQHNCNKQIINTDSSGATSKVYDTNYNQIKLNDSYDMCCSNYPINDLLPADPEQPNSKKNFISQLIMEHQ